MSFERDHFVGVGINFWDISHGHDGQEFRYLLYDSIDILIGVYNFGNKLIGDGDLIYLLANIPIKGIYITPFWFSL